MVRIMIAPNRYIQGAGVLNDTANYINHLGSKIFFIGGRTAFSTVMPQISASFKSVDGNPMEYVFESFSGECTRKAAADLAAKAGEFQADVVAGVGGGRAIDTAKAVAFDTGAALVIIPTIASNDAPCSALSVQYNEDHSIDRFLILKRNPDVVLVDTKIIAEAPVRFLVSGMGDALATWFEAFACAKSGAKNFPGGITTSAALSLARLCYDTLMQYGISAKLDVDRNNVTEAVEKVVEANILLSGIGFESSGLAAAHGIHDGLHSLEGAERSLHGEIVAFGTITQMVLENYSGSETERVIAFCKTVGLPVTLKQIGIIDTSPANLIKAAEAACQDGLPIHNLYFKVNPDLVLNAIIEADTLGRIALS
jgi:glycerol dehydrogenase